MAKQSIKSLNSIPAVNKIVNKIKITSINIPTWQYQTALSKQSAVYMVIAFVMLGCSSVNSLNSKSFVSQLHPSMVNNATLNFEPNRADAATYFDGVDLSASLNLQQKEQQQNISQTDTLSRQQAYLKTQRAFKSVSSEQSPFRGQLSQTLDEEVIDPNQELLAMARKHSGYDEYVDKSGKGSRHSNSAKLSYGLSKDRLQPYNQSQEHLPAFIRLMQQGVQQLEANQLKSAEDSFTRAQRIAPQSSQVYLYLSKIALDKQQPTKAEAMARRGLLVAKNTENKYALWQVVLYSGEMRDNVSSMNEAKSAMALLK